VFSVRAQMASRKHGTTFAGYMAQIGARDPVRNRSSNVVVTLINNPYFSHRPMRATKTAPESLHGLAGARPATVVGAAVNGMRARCRSAWASRCSPTRMQTSRSAMYWDQTPSRGLEIAAVFGQLYPAYTSRHDACDERYLSAH